MTDSQIVKQLIVSLYARIFPRANGNGYTFSQVAFKLIVIWLPLISLLVWLMTRMIFS